MQHTTVTPLRYVVWMCFVGILLLASSCRNSRNTAQGDTGYTTPEAVQGGLANKAVQIINASRPTGQYVTAKANLKLQAGQKDVSVGGTLRMKRDDVIQLSLAFMGLMEVGRMEITPDYFMLVDRMNHQYVRAAYSDVPFFQQAGINFHTFQSLFWGELFLPNDGGNVPEGSQFQQQVAGDTLLLSRDVHTHATLHFVASMSRALLLQTSLTRNTTAEALPLMTWDYSSYKPFGGKQFPTGMRMNISSGKTQAQVTLALSNLKSNSEWTTRTEINTKKYTPVSIESIIKRLQRLSL